MPQRRYISPTGLICKTPSYKCTDWVGKQACIIYVADTHTGDHSQEIWLVEADELSVHRKLAELNKNKEGLEFLLHELSEIYEDHEGFLYLKDYITLDKKH